MGDVLYASSLAKKLKEQGYDRVVYLNGIPQVKGMLTRNPYINEVLTTHTPTNDTHHIAVKEHFDKEIYIQQCTFIKPPAIQMQIDAEIKNPSPEFEVYTDPEIDSAVEREYRNRPYVTIMEPTSWEAKTYLFTRDEYKRGIDIPPKGYSGKNRDVRNIIKIAMKEHPDLSVLYVGADADHPTMSIPFSNGHRSLDLEASLIKYSIAFIGAEGGLANVAAGGGTRTILTYDFVHQLYGWNGVIRKVSPEPKLGPRYYFPDVKHVDINPFLSDNEVGIEIGKCLHEDYSGQFNDAIFVGQYAQCK